MFYLSRVILTLTVALWLGSLAALFLMAPAVFRAFGDDRATAGIATSAMFIVFARWQLAVAAAALIGAFLAYSTTRRTIYWPIFALIALAALGAVANAWWLVPKMETLRQAGQGASDEFKRLHGQSMLLYVSKASLVLITALLLPGTYDSRVPKQATEGFASA